MKKQFFISLSAVACWLGSGSIGAAELKEVPVREALARRFPEEIVLVTYLQGDRPGIVALGNNQVIPGVIALKRGTPAQAAVSTNQEFVMAFPGEDLAAAVRKCFAGESAPLVELAGAGLTASPPAKVRSPLLPQCLVNYECRVKSQADAGDATVFLGDVVATHPTPSRARRLYLAGWHGADPVLKAFAGAREPPVPAGFEKYPEQVVMITACDENGKPNAMTAGWTMRVSDDPPMLAVAIGKSRYTHDLVRRSREFVCGYPGADMEAEMLYCGTHTGRNVDKFREANLAIQPGKKVRLPLLAKWQAAFECRVAAELDLGSHTLFIGTIETAHVSDRQAPRLYNLGPAPGGRRVFQPLE